MLVAVLAVLSAPGAKKDERTEHRTGKIRQHKPTRELLCDPYQRHPSDSEPPSLTRQHKRLWPFTAADACENVYIDLGTYDGNSIEAWYLLDEHMKADDKALESLANKLGGQWCTPSKRHKDLNKLSNDFDVRLRSETFGHLNLEARRKFCSIGLEGNPVFNSRLAAMQAELTRLGKPVHVYSSTAAVVGHNRPVTFHVNALKNTGGRPRDTVRGGLAANVNAKRMILVNETVTVPSLDLISLLRHVNARARTVVLKVDLESLEFVVVKALLDSGELCAGKVKFLMVEWKNPELIKDWANKRDDLVRLIKEQAGGCSGIHITDWD